MKHKKIIEALRHSAHSVMLVGVSSILAFAMHSAIAAPSGPPTNPAQNVSPNFDGLTITDGGKISAQNNSNVTQVEIDGQEGAIFIKNSAGTQDVFSVDGTVQVLKGSGAKLDIDGDTGLATLDDQSLKIFGSGQELVNVGVNSGGHAILSLTSAVNGKGVELQSETGTILAKNVGHFYVNDRTTAGQTINATSTLEDVAACGTGDIAISCSGLLDAGAPYDVDYNGAWRSSTSECRSRYTNKTASNYTGAMGTLAICFSPDGSGS